jgi:uncharacterized protein YgiM (DUF1202 family)
VGLLGFFLSTTALFGAGTPTPPYVGEVAGNRVNIRSGASLNYRILKVANNGDKVIVRDVKNGWARIDTPTDVHFYISKDYIRPDKDSQGVLTGDQVNVRPSPNLREPPLCQLQKNERVRIVDSSGNFFKIEPPAEAYAWISAKYVRYFGELDAVTKQLTAKLHTDKKLSGVLDKEKEMWAQPASKRDLVALMASYAEIINDNSVGEEARKIALQRRTELEELKQLEDVKGKSEELASRVAASQTVIEQLKRKAEDLERKLVEITTPPPPPPTYAGKGVVRRLERVWNRPGTHQLVDNTGKVLFLLKSDSHNLDEFENKFVGINGELEKLRGWHLQLLHVDQVDMLEGAETK